MNLLSDPPPFNYANEPNPTKRQAALDAQAERIQRDGRRMGENWGWCRGDSDYLEQRFDCVAYKAKIKQDKKDNVGEGNGHAKISEGHVVTLRQLYKDGMSMSAISRQFNMPSNTVCNIIRGLSWSHVPGAIPSDGRGHKLNPDKVIAMRAGFESGRTKSDLARSFGVSIPTVTQVIDRVTWSHIK